MVIEPTDPPLTVWVAGRAVVVDDDDAHADREQAATVRSIRRRIGNSGWDGREVLCIQQDREIGKNRSVGAESLSSFCPDQHDAAHGVRTAVAPRR